MKNLFKLICISFLIIIGLFSYLKEDRSHYFESSRYSPRVKIHKALVEKKNIDSNLKSQSSVTESSAEQDLGSLSTEITLQSIKDDPYYFSTFKRLVRHKCFTETCDKDKEIVIQLCSQTEYLLHTLDDNNKLQFKIINRQINECDAWSTEVLVVDQEKILASNNQETLIQYLDNNPIKNDEFFKKINSLGFDYLAYRLDPKNNPSEADFWDAFGYGIDPSRIKVERETIASQGNKNCYVAKLYYQKKFIAETSGCE